jgi:hypothetical protein
MFASRRRRRMECGAQSLEWIGLGGFVLAAMGAATMYAQGHLGDQLGKVLIDHIQKALGG